jgi:hypothetical protein
MEISVEEKGRGEKRFISWQSVYVLLVSLKCNPTTGPWTRLSSIINHHAFVVSIASPPGVEYHAVASLVISQAHLLNLNTRPF